MAWGYQLNTEFDFESPFFWPEYAFPWGAAALLGVGATTTTGATTSAGSTTTKTNSTPSWITSLQDPKLKADMASRYNSITAGDMAAALGDLASEVNSSTSKTLTASQFADLKSIASNIGSTGASSYLQFITNAFVNGNAANAWWTGGAAKSVALGNLAAGSP